MAATETVNDMATQRRKAIRNGCGYWEIDTHPSEWVERVTPYDGPLVFITDITGPVDSIEGKLMRATTADGRRIAVPANVLTR